MSNHKALIVYGATCSGKSSFLSEYLRRLLPQGAKARIYTCEHYDAYDDVVNEGLAEVWRFNNRPHPFYTTHKVVENYWPENLLDPKSLLKAPGPDFYDRYPVRIYEGIFTTGQYITSNHVEGGLLERAGRGEKFGGQEMDHIQFMDGEIGVGGMNWPMYNVSQNELVGLVEKSQEYPGHVIWTSHEDEGKQNGKTVLGPAVIGNKMTTAIGAKFGNLWHAVEVPTFVNVASSDEKKTVFEKRLYLKPHLFPGTQLLCLSKTSVSLRNQAKIPDYMQMSKGGLPDLEACDRLIKLLG